MIVAQMTKRLMSKALQIVSEQNELPATGVQIFISCTPNNKVAYKIVTQDFKRYEIDFNTMLGIKFDPLDKEGITERWIVKKVAEWEAVYGAKKTSFIVIVHTTDKDAKNVEMCLYQGAKQIKSLDFKEIFE